MDQVVMLLPFYEGAPDVKIYLEERGLNVDKAQKECSLVVADALTWFFHSGVNVKSFLGILTEDSLQVGKKGITLIADMDCFFLNEKVEDLVDYELSMPVKNDLSIKVVCCYNSGDFDRLDKEQQEQLIANHYRAISVYGIEHTVNFEEALAYSVSEALSILGNEVSSVVQNHLQQKYSIKIADEIGERPGLLSEALNTALDGGARIVERRILRLLYQKMGSNFPSLSHSAVSADFEDRILEAKKAYDSMKKTLELEATTRALSQ
jgi:hypothetical protein